MPPPAHSLDPLFRPQSVAVVGASATRGSVGHILLRNLLASPFGGPVFPVNPNRRSVQGVYAYPTLRAVPGPVDLAVIATPAATAPEQVQAAVECGAKGAIVISAGFSELGPAGRDLERQVRDVAKGKLRLIGPNCLGVIYPPANLNASFAAGMAWPGTVALLSQSGAICTSILDWSHTAHVGFSAFVSVGAMIDVDFAALIDYFGDDPGTRSIVIYMESIGDVRSFLSAARAVARAKPIIVVKSGRHEAGARAAASHTGALAGSDAVFDAAFRRAGVLRVQTIRDLFNMSEILSMQPQPRGPALGIVTNAGGPGVMAIDALMTNGGALAELSPATREALDRLLPPFWSRANPIDILGDATPERYRQTVELCVKDEHMQGLLILLTPQAMTDPTETARLMAPFARAAGKPVLAAWLGGETVQPGKELLRRAGVPAFDTPESAVRAFLHMVQYRRAQELLYETPEAVPDFQPDAARVRRGIDAARREGRRLLTEFEAKDLLAAYDIPVVPTVTAAGPDEAAVAARELGYPVVLKLLSPTITHKTDAGGVQLNLPDADAVRNAFETIRGNAYRYARERGLSPSPPTPLPRGERGERSTPPSPLVGEGGRGGEGDLIFAGVTVQPMVTLQGQELIIGSSLDAQFGPVILFGAGGVLVEVFQDRALALPPLNRTLARRLMERTKIYDVLKGVRGQRGVDLMKLETLLVRFSQLVAEQADVQEIDINPLLAGPDGIIALDARVLLSDPKPTDGGRWGLAILPYPNQYTAPFRLADGSEVTVRVIRPEDEPLIVEHHALLSEQSIRLRYFGLVKHLTRDRLIRLCHLDYNREMALVAVHTDENGPHIWGVSRYYFDPETGSAEFALLVADPYQGRGLGHHLMQRLIEVAKDRGVKRLTGLVLRENRPMLDLLRPLGFTATPSDDPTTVEAVLEL
jgi:acetyltransferase